MDTVRAWCVVCKAEAEAGESGKAFDGLRAVCRCPKYLTDNGTWPCWSPAWVRSAWNV